MRDRWSIAIALAASAVVVSACSSIGPLPTQLGGGSQVQSDLAGCRAAARSAGALAACSRQHGPALAKLAQDNFEQASRAQDRATRINLYASAAKDGWDSGIDTGLQTADAAIQAGGGECSKIPAGEFTPTRDCLLFRVGPGFVAHVRTSNLVDRVEAKSAATAADKKQLNDASVRYVRNTFDFVEDRRRQFDADPTLDDSMRTMLDRQRSVFYCTALHIAAVNRKLGQVDTARRVSRDRDRILTANSSLQGETCLSAS